MNTLTTLEALEFETFDALQTRDCLEDWDDLENPFPPDDPRSRYDWFPLLPDYGYDEEGYLYSDVLPMAEHETHRDNMFYTISELQNYFAPRAQEVYVGGNNFLHYHKGDRSRYVSPDCFVVFGVRQRNRQNYKSWKEGGRLPSVVFEITSVKTQKVDEVDKYALYEQTLSVPEYIRFDPYGDYLRPQVQGFTLVEGRYEPMPYEPDGRLYSAELDLYLETQGQLLRLYDAKIGEYLRTPPESEQERILEKARAEQERRRANAAEVREDAERKRAQAEAAGRREERRRAEAEKARADAEANAREAAEAELARLRAELEALRKSAEG